MEQLPGAAPSPAPLHYAAPSSAQLLHAAPYSAQTAEWHKEVDETVTSESDKTVIPGFRVPFNPPLGFKPTVPGLLAPQLTQTAAKLATRGNRTRELARCGYCQKCYL